MLTEQQELWAAVTAANITKGAATVPASVVLHGIRLALALGGASAAAMSSFAGSGEPAPRPLGPSADRQERSADEEDET